MPREGGSEDIPRCPSLAVSFSHHFLQFARNERGDIGQHVRGCQDTVFQAREQYYVQTETSKASLFLPQDEQDEEILHHVRGLLAGTLA
jgi:hypothetical protein